MSEPDAVKQAWQASIPNPVLPDPATLRAGADRLYRGVRIRNCIEYIASLCVVLLFGALAVAFPLRGARIGAAMIVIGVLVVAWQLHRRASAVPPPLDGAQSVLAYQRAQLARQRDALASIFTWYLLPVLPGVLVMVGAILLVVGINGRVLLRLAPTPLIFGIIWWANHWGARRLQQRIDEIDALMGEGR